MVLDIKICLSCEAYHRAVRQLPLVKADSGYKGPANVYEIYAKIINAQNNPRQTPLAGT